jgi:sugar/nucleoside kinase (ribokinase family)
LYRDIIIKPNRFEAKRAVEFLLSLEGPGVGGTEVTIEEAQRCGEQLCKHTGKPVYVTIGAKGILVITKEGCQHVPGIPLTGELDPVGAGDSVSAGIVSTLCSGGSYREAAEVGNLVASITVTKIGTTGTASHDEIIQRLKLLNTI